MLPGAGVVPAPSAARGGSGSFAGLLAGMQNQSGDAADPTQPAMPLAGQPPPQGGATPATPELPTTVKPGATKPAAPSGSQPLPAAEATAEPPPAAPIVPALPTPPVTEPVEQPPTAGNVPGPLLPAPPPAEMPAEPVVAPHQPSTVPRSAAAAPTRDSEKKPAKPDVVAADQQLPLQPQPLPDPPPPPDAGALPPPPTPAASTSDTAVPNHLAGVGGVIGHATSPPAPIAEKPAPASAVVSPETLSASAAVAVPQHAAAAHAEPAKPSVAALPQEIASAGATLAARIGRAVEDGTHVLTVALHPAELGRVELRLSFHTSGVEVQMTMSRPETYDAFTRNRGAMEQHLNDAGINLGSGGLDLRFGQQSDRSMPPPSPVRIAVPGETTTVTSQPQTRSAAIGLVDILA